MTNQTSEDEIRSVTYLRVSQAADVLGVSKSLLNKWRVTGCGPSYVKVGRSVRYVQAEILNWASKRTFQSTSGYDQSIK